MTPSQNLRFKQRKLEYATELLEAIYGRQERYSSKNGLEQLIATVLSQRTNYENERKAFETMFERFGDWDGIASADIKELTEAIKTTTYPEQKAPRIQEILKGIYRKRGEYSLEFLRNAPVEEAMKWVMSFPGVGHKTATFMLLFTFRKPVMPVDTHVYRVCLRLNMYTKKMTQAKAHDFLLSILPEDADSLLNFHKLFFEHGQRVCTYNNPQCSQCVLLDICPTGQSRTGNGSLSRTTKELHAIVWN